MVAAGGHGSPKGTTDLLGRSGSLSAGRLGSGVLTVALAASGRATATGRGVLTAAANLVSLSARLASGASARGVLGLLMGLTARGGTKSAVRSSLNGTADLSSRSRARVAGKASPAPQVSLLGRFAAVAAASGPGSSTTQPFITYANDLVQLSPDDLIALGLQVQARISAITFKGRDLKDMSPIPADYTTESHWE